MEVISKCAVLFRELPLRAIVKLESNPQLSLFAFGVVLLMLGSSEEVFAGTERQATDRLLGYIEGPFGALITAAAGVGAIVSASLGGFKVAWTLVVTSIGAFILRSYISLWFGSTAPLGAVVGGFGTL